MKFLFDLFPVFLLFISYKIGDLFPTQVHALVNSCLSGVVVGGKISTEMAPILFATSIAILASFLQIGYLLARRHKIDTMLWLSLVSITIFGGMTIYFQDQDFIKWKPTIMYWCFGLGMLVSEHVFKKNPIRNMMEEQIKLPDGVWSNLLHAYILFFTAYGALNLVVAFVVLKGNFGAYTTFKAFGQPAIFFVFIVFQTFYLAKHLDEEQA